MLVKRLRVDDPALTKVLRHCFAAILATGGHSICSRSGVTFGPMMLP